MNSKWNAHYFIYFTFLTLHLIHPLLLYLTTHHFQFLINLTSSQMIIHFIQNYLFFNSFHPPLFFKNQFIFHIINCDINQLIPSYFIIFRSCYLPNESIYNLIHFMNNYQLIYLYLFANCFCQLLLFVLRNDIDSIDTSVFIMNFWNENFCGHQFISTLLNHLRSHLLE